MSNENDKGRVKTIPRRRIARFGKGIAISLVALAAALFATSGIYVVDTGHVAVEKTLGTVDTEEVGKGIHWRLPLATEVKEFSAKEISFDLQDLKPKAVDNLSLQDLDITVYYKVIENQIAETEIKYAGVSMKARDAYYPGYHLVFREARGAAYDSVSQVDSLQLHKQRDTLGDTIMEKLQKRLDAAFDGTFTVTRVIVRALNTDPSIEQAIRMAVENEKRLEAKRIEVEIAREDALIEIERAKGIAEANRIINESLTAAYLQHEINTALYEFAQSGGSVVVIPANMQGFEMILDTKAITAKK